MPESARDASRSGGVPSSSSFGQPTAFLSRSETRKPDSNSYGVFPVKWWFLVFAQSPQRADRGLSHFFLGPRPIPLCNLARGPVILPVGTGLPVTASSVGRKSEDYVAEATLRLFMPPLSHPRRSENPASAGPDPGPWLAAYPAGSPPRCTAVSDASCTGYHRPHLL